MDQSLVVPLNIAALRVGTVDASVKTVHFAGQTTDFSNAPYVDASGNPMSNKPSTSENILLDMAQGAQDSLEKGVHLHWALPDALTHGSFACRLTADSLTALGGLPAAVLAAAGKLLNTPFAAEESLMQALQDATAGAAGAFSDAILASLKRGITFPPVPNRWLVTRALTPAAGGAPQYKQWVVESDRLTTTQEHETYVHATGRTTRPIPIAAARGEAPFRYLGRAFDLKDWSEAGAAGAYLDNLTAVGYSGTAFASYYPDCLGSFGFHDTLRAGEGAPQGADLNLSYQVVGWYSDPRKDPLFGVSADQAADACDWIIKLGAAPTRTLCAGLVRHIPWNSGKDLLDPVPDLSTVKLALGNTTTEALSALIKDAWKKPGDPLATPSLDPQVGANIEFLLDAFQLGMLDKLSPGGHGLAKLEDALHQNTFGSTAGGMLWGVRKPGSDDLRGAAETSQVSLPAAAAHALNVLNDAQQKFNRASDEVQSRREQIFFDWYKYIYTAYPADGSAADAGLLDARERYLTLELRALAARQTEIGQTIGADLAAKTAALAEALKETAYEMRRTPGPRFWQPNEPVLLLSGNNVKPMLRNGTDGKLACRLATDLLSPPSPPAVPRTPAAIPGAADVDRILVEAFFLDGLAPDLLTATLKSLGAAAPHSIAFQDWKSPWLPLFMHWQVEFKPIIEGQSRKYAPSYICDNFDLDPNHIDLLPKKVQWGYQAYSGTITLSSRAALNLADQINKFVESNPDEDADGELLELAGAVKDMPLLSQGLSGLNQAFLTRKQTLQLPPSDPLTQDDDSISNNEVRAAVVGATACAPMPEASFTPLRAGFLRVAQLDLVDVFGQRGVMSAPLFIRSRGFQSVNGPDNDVDAYLAPRLIQPSRLLFRWLSADDDDIEMNDHPATTPICGWIIPNHWDQSLAIYDDGGKPLGSLGLEGSGTGVVWRTAPGSKGAAAGKPGDDLTGTSKALAAFVNNIYNKPKGYLADMLASIESAGLNILPGMNKSQGLGVLIGQPLALARANLRLELQGLPAVDLSTSAFDADVTASPARSYDPATRQIGGVAEVNFPVRLGDLSQADDGLVGYFIDGDQGENFFCPAADPGGTNGVLPPAPGQLQVNCRSAAGVTILLDPRAEVHATTGMLPVKSIAIPADQYLDTLKALNVTFFVNPVLTGKDSLNLPVPAENGARWSWAQAGKPEQPLADNQVDDRAELAYGPQRLLDGWLKLSPTPPKAMS